MSVEMIIFGAILVAICAVMLWRNGKGNGKAASAIKIILICIGIILIAYGLNYERITGEAMKLNIKTP